MSSSEDITARFGTADYIVFVGVLMVSAGIGVFYACSGGKQNSTSEFLMGNRSMRVIPVAMSILASFISAITLLGTPAEMYQFGIQYMAIVVSFFFVIPMAAYVYLPMFYDLQLTSAYEYLDLRFNKIVRSMASAVFSLQMMIYMAIVLYAPALALSQVTGLSVWFSVLSIGIVCTFYTSIGGIKAVIWTDFFQIFMMFASMLIVVIKGSYDVGGLHYIWNVNYHGNRTELFNFDPNPMERHTVWNLIIGGYFTWVAVYGVNQAMVQRYLTLPSMKKAQTALWINLPGLVFLVVLCGLAGMIIYGKYHDCDPIVTKKVKASDQLFPLFVMDTLGDFPGLPGLFVSGIFSGALSTVSSGVNSMAAVTLEDGIKAYFVKDISEKWATRMTKILAVVYGVIAIILVAVAQQLGNVLQAALSIFGMIGGPLLGLFSFGMFVPWANSFGAIFGLLGGLTLSFWLGLGAFVNKPYVPKAPISVDGCLDLYFNVTQANHTFLSSPLILTPPPPHEEILHFYRISYMWYSAFGCVCTIIIGLIVSICTGGPKLENQDRRYMSPIVVRFFQKLPTRISKKLKVDFLLIEDEKKKETSHLCNCNCHKGTTEKNGVVNMAFAPSTHDLSIAYRDETKATEMSSRM